MGQAAIRDEIAAPIERVWGCFADFGDLSAWAPGRTTVPVEGHGVGAVRTVGGEDGPVIRERLDSYDAAHKTFSYAMLDSPFPFTDYVATVRLRDLGNSRTSIEWSSTFEPRGVSTEEATAAIESIYRMFVARLKETLGVQLAQRARCSCGRLEVKISADPESVVACHCIDCQRRTGSVLGVGAYFAKEHVTVSGESKVFVRPTDAGNQFVTHFCPNCGTSIYWYSDRNPDRIGVAVGAFANPSFPGPVRSVWEQSMHSWVAVTPAVQHLPKGRVG
jgi:hypothetical protein